MWECICWALITLNPAISPLHVAMQPDLTGNSSDHGSARSLMPAPSTPTSNSTDHRPAHDFDSQYCSPETWLIASCLTSMVGPTYAPLMARFLKSYQGVHGITSVLHSLVPFSSSSMPRNSQEQGQEQTRNIRHGLSDLADSASALTVGYLLQQNGVPGMYSCMWGNFAGWAVGRMVRTALSGDQAGDGLAQTAGLSRVGVAKHGYSKGDGKNEGNGVADDHADRSKAAAHARDAVVVGGP